MNAPTRIVVTVAEDPQYESEFKFEDATRITIGRSADCDIRLPGDRGHRDVSRHHCLLTINPPSIRVRDLGSRNGTFINGARIGSPEHIDEDNEVDNFESPEYELMNGDEVLIGHAVMRIRVEPHYRTRASVRVG